MKTLKFSSVRLSHLLRHCAVGSIVRTSQFCVTVKDTSFWADKEGRPFGKEILYIEQIKKSLGITQKLRRPPVGKIDNEGEFEYDSGYYIPAQVFPSWFVCIKCRRLHKGSHKQLDDSDRTDKSDKKDNKTTLICNESNCHGELEQVHLVQADNRGYLYDVPWYRIAHYGQEKCDWHISKLYWYARAGNGKRENTVACTCGASNTLSLDKPIYFQGYQQPWLYDACFKVDGRQLEEEHGYGHGRLDASKPQPTAYIMEVNDTRVHTPITKEALVIPPESRIVRGTLVDRLYCHEKKDELLGGGSIYSDEQKALKNRLRIEFDCDNASLEEVIKLLREGYPNFDREFQEKPLHELEYEALITPADFDDDEDFVTHHVSDEFHQTLQSMNQDKFGKLDKLIDKVVAVNKLKEILVFNGFTRGGESPPSDSQKGTESRQTQSHGMHNDREQDKENRTVPPDVVGVSNWLPALELYGEGIFISFNESVIKCWQQDEQIQKRAEIFAERLSGSIHAHTLNQKDIVANARFLFLHAFSHLLIKELESLAGYPAASLKEKIYSSSNPNEPMAGVLIYTAIADVDGTLGGLVELSEPKSMIQVLNRVFEKVEWCSLDPVCGSHEGQGPSLLNRAACHCCLLLPETSCMCGNVLLDRVMIKGDERTPSIFDFVK